MIAGGRGTGATAIPLDLAGPADEPARAAPPRRRPDWPVVVLGALLAVAAAVVAFEAQRVSGRRVVYGLSPGGVPFAVAAGLGLLGVCVVIEGLRGLFPARDHDRVVPVLWIVGGLVAQLALLKTAGFSVATGLVFATTAKAMGRGPLWATVPAGIVLSFVLFVAFSQGLNLALPAGPPERAFLELVRPALPAAPPPAAAAAPPASPPTPALAPAPAAAAPAN